MKRFSYYKAHIQTNKNVQYCPMAAIFFMQETFNSLLCELCMLGNFSILFLLSAFFSSKLTLQKNSSEIPSLSNSLNPNQARSDLSGLIWLQTVCRQAGKKLFIIIYLKKNGLDNLKVEGIDLLESSQVNKI